MGRKTKAAHLSVGARVRVQGRTSDGSWYGNAQGEVVGVVWDYRYARSAAFDDVPGEFRQGATVEAYRVRLDPVVNMRGEVRREGREVEAPSFSVLPLDVRV